MTAVGMSTQTETTPANSVTIDPAVQLHKVTKSFETSMGKVTALHEIDLEIRRGEFVEIRGHSGSGKSTLLALLGGLATPTDGSVDVFGESVSDMSAAGRADFRSRSIGFVFQLFHLLPYLNVKDNVLLAASDVADSRDQSRADSLLKELGLADRMTHRPGQLSAGERQRVALARALFNEPKLLLADEPTGNLDAENATIVMQRMIRFQASGGTVVLVTHDTRSESTGRRLIHLDHGKIQSA